MTCLQLSYIEAIDIKQQKKMNRPSTSLTPFETWGLDLLANHIQKYHHRNIHRR